MLTVDDYGRIRRAHRDGMSIRAIARMLHHSRRKIRQVLAEPEPKPYTRIKEPLCPVLGPYQAIINEILKQDEQSNTPRKQRHTAAKIFRRLKEEHRYQGSYIQIRRFVREHKRADHRISGTFIPLNHDPGQRLECDFGHVVIQFPEGRRQVPVLQVVWSFSGHRFSIGLPSEKVTGFRSTGRLSPDANRRPACSPHSRRARRPDVPRGSPALFSTAAPVSRSAAISRR